jgi:hypothetical protein
LAFDVLLDACELDALLSQHAATNRGVQTMLQMLDVLRCLPARAARSNICCEIEAHDNAEHRLVTWIVPDVESRLDHEAVEQY